MAQCYVQYMIPSLFSPFQLSGGAPPSPSSSSSTSQLAELQGKLEKAQGSLQRMTTERDQALSDLAALRDSLVQQQEDSARRVRTVETLYIV